MRLCQYPTQCAVVSAPSDVLTGALALVVSRQRRLLVPNRGSDFVLPNDLDAQRTVAGAVLFVVVNIGFNVVARHPPALDIHLVDN